MHQPQEHDDVQPLPDAELARRIAGGDLSVLPQLMRRHNQTLYRTTRSILNDEAEAEDAVQETYLHAYRAMAQFQGNAKLSTWLVRIAVNVALERLRKRKRRAEVIDLYGDAVPDDAMLKANMGDRAPEQPEQILLRMEMRRLVEDKVSRLPDAFRAVFVLRALEEMSVDETADCLGIPAETVRTRYFRARGLLREALAREIDTCIADAFSFAGERCDRIVAGVMAKLDPSGRKA